MNPYTNLGKKNFWKTGVVESLEDLSLIHRAKWKISKNDIIVTMGSCFAQHVRDFLKKAGFNVPYFDNSNNVKSINFSANYGNVYTVRQALQLMREVNGSQKRSETVYEVEKKFIDPFRPNVFSSKFITKKNLILNRMHHLKAVRNAFTNLDIFILTLGLTEAWEIKKCESILPIAPGILGGKYNKDKYLFKNFSYEEIQNDLLELIKEILKIRNNKKFKLLLTVSPVPLTATAEDRHILVSNIASKSILRSISEYFYKNFDFIDYFPSYEIITNPLTIRSNYLENFRSVSNNAVKNVMNLFINSYLENSNKEKSIQYNIDKKDLDCEEALIDGVGDIHYNSNSISNFLFFGNSHLGTLINALPSSIKNISLFVPTNFLINDPILNINDQKFQKFIFNNIKYKDIEFHKSNIVVIVGNYLMGDGIIRCFGNLQAGFFGCKGSEISPSINDTYDIDFLNNIFEKKIVSSIRHIQKIDNLNFFKKVIYIASPDFPEKVARFRLGDRFVDSLYYNNLKKIYFSKFIKITKDLIPNVKLIFHENITTNSKTGFLKDKYANSSKIWDIHPLKDFYIDSGAYGKLLSFLNNTL